jgi:hypothetical protein
LHDSRDQHEGDGNCETWPIARFEQQMRAIGLINVVPCAAN